MFKFGPFGAAAIFVTAILTQSCSSGLPTDGYSPVDIVDSAKPISHVDGFEIQYVGVGEKGVPFFEIGYAIWANYPYFTYAGETYERAGVGGVLIRRDSVRPTRYLVTETVKKMDRSGLARESTLTIMDKDARVVVAHRALRQGEIENQMGWVGQHAAEFVRKNLLTDAPVGIGGVGTKVYPRFPVEIESLPIDQFSHHDSGCGPAISVSTGKPFRTLDAPLWRFYPQAPISDFACSDGYVLVLSNVYPTDLFLDVLTLDGRYVWQTEIVRSAPPLGRSAIQVKLDGASFLGSSVDFNLITARAYLKGNVWERRPEQYDHVHMSIESHRVK